MLSFAELKELIETGNVDKIPNNKIIPEGLNVMSFTTALCATQFSFTLTMIQDAPPSQSTAPARKKPWETVETQEST